MLTEIRNISPNPSRTMGGANSAFEPFKKKKEGGVTIKLCDKIRKVFICIREVFHRKSIRNRMSNRFKPTLDKRYTYQTIKIHRVD